ncbi:hypothetical protein D3C75_923340 [compost metagenome]
MVQPGLTFSLVFFLPLGSCIIEITGQPMILHPIPQSPAQIVPVLGKMFISFIHLLNVLENRNDPARVRLRKQSLIQQVPGQEKRLQGFGRIFSRFELIPDIDGDSVQQQFLLRLVYVFKNTNVDPAFPHPELAVKSKLIID